jgi:hypothetical protein
VGDERIVSIDVASGVLDKTSIMRRAAFLRLCDQLRFGVWDKPSMTRRAIFEGYAEFAKDLDDEASQF